MSGRRVKYMGHLGKSREPVVAGTGCLEMRAGDQPGKMDGARQ